MAFSPKGELIVSESEDGIIVVDARAGELMPTTYSPHETIAHVYSVGISFDSSKLAAMSTTSLICVWDLPSGTLLHSFICGGIHEIQWSWTDQYLLFKPPGVNPRYLNAETFQEEVPEHLGDRFQQRNPLYYDRKTHKIRLSSGREGPLFLILALPSNLIVGRFSSWGDRVCIIGEDERPLLLDTSGLGAYMEICDLQFEPKVSYLRSC